MKGKTKFVCIVRTPKIGPDAHIRKCIVCLAPIGPGTLWERVARRGAPSVGICCQCGKVTP